jgi:hypothetical protein
MGCRARTLTSPVRRRSPLRRAPCHVAHPPDEWMLPAPSWVSAGWMQGGIDGPCRFPTTLGCRLSSRPAMEGASAVQLANAHSYGRCPAALQLPGKLVHGQQIGLQADRPPLLLARAEELLQISILYHTYV